MTPEFKAAVTAAIIRDRSRVQTLSVAFSLAVAGAIATRVVGVHLPVELNIAITGAVTMGIGWWIEGIGANANVKAGAKVQDALATATSAPVGERGVLDATTVQAAQDVAAAANSPKPNQTNQ